MCFFNIIFNEMMMMGFGGLVQNLYLVFCGIVFIDFVNLEVEFIVNYCGGINEIDLEIMVENVYFMRCYMIEGELVQYDVIEMSLGLLYEIMEQLIFWVRGVMILLVYYLIGICVKMLCEWGGVVDEELFVYGVGRFLIIDVLIFLMNVGVIIQQSVYVVVEKVSFGFGLI